MVFPKTEWQTATPESKGIDSGAILRALEAIEASDKDIHSMLIVRDGTLVFEHYFSPYDAQIQHSMYSCSKTFTSMLIGIAQEKGLLSIHDTVLSYFPEVPISSPNEYLRAMTLRDLLVMGSGHDEDTFGPMVEAEDGNWPRVFLNQPVTHQPGTYFVYNTGATYMLSNILTKVTGKTALELANEWLFPVLGIENAVWDTDPQGISLGGTGLHIKPRDMARFGLLIQNEGKWKDMQVIPRDYVLEAQQKQIDNAPRGADWGNPNWICGYGYQMWRCDFGAFRADGMGGQYIVLMPDRGLLFVFTSALGSDIAYPLTVIEEILLPGIQDSALPENTQTATDLAALSQKLSRPKETSMPPEAENFPWNRLITVGNSQLNIKTIEFQKDALLLSNAEETVKVPFSWGAPVVSRAFSDGSSIISVGNAPNPPVAATAIWADGLRLTLQFVGEPSTVRLYPRVTGNEIAIRVWFSLQEEITLRGTIG